MRFDHMELTVARGSLTSEFCQEVDAFYGAVFGWSAFDSQVGNRTAHLLQPDPNQFILLVESDTPMSVQGIEHLGLLLDSRAEVDQRRDECERYAEKDDRVSVLRQDDLVYPALTVHTFYLKYLLPISFDVHSFDHAG
jgi:hypothetical protein